MDAAAAAAAAASFYFCYSSDRVIVRYPAHPLHIVWGNKLGALLPGQRCSGASYRRLFTSLHCKLHRFWLPAKLVHNEKVSQTGSIIAIITIAEHLS